MPRLNEYFRTEARDFLVALERGLQRASGPDTAELHRVVRGLRGTAQMAREHRIYDVVSALEPVTRALAAGSLAWSDHVAARARATVADLRVLFDNMETDEQLDARVSEAAARWRDTQQALAHAAPVQSADSAVREFREFIAREAAGIADALDAGIRDLQTDPMDREPLKVILRRQRALLGSARLDEIPVVADILRAVEDLTRVIAKLDVGVKQEWLDIYRVARDGLQTTIAPLLRGELPEPSHSVSRLRHMREELLERYGTGEEESAPHGSTFTEPAPPRPVAPFVARTQAPAAYADAHDEGAVLELDEESVVATAPPDLLNLDEGSVVDGDADGDAIGIDTLAYTREDALARALELRDVITRVAAHDPQARDAAEELFDLIRIALG